MSEQGRKDETDLTREDLKAMIAEGEPVEIADIPPDDFIPTDEAATRREDGLVGWDHHGPVFVAPEPEVISRLLK